MAEVQAEAAKSQVAVPVKPTQLDDFAKRIKAEAAKLARQIEVDIPATIEGEKFRRDAAAKIEGLSKLLEVKVPMDLENAVAFRRQVLDQLAEVEALAKVTHPTVNMKVDVDKSILTRLRSGFSAVEGVAQKAAGAVADVGSSIAEAATGFVSKLNPATVAFVGLIAAAVPLAADMVASLGPGLLVALPAIAAVGAGIGVIALGMDALVGGKGKKGKRSGGALEPIISGFKGLRDVIGETLAKGVRPLAKEFAQNAIPVIKTGLTGIAKVMNGFLKDFLSWVGSASTVKLIGQVFDGLASAMKPIGGAATVFADALLRIVKDAAPGLRTVTGVIKTLAVQFDNFIKSKDKDGSLTKTISDSIAATGNLIGALVNLGKAVGGLFTDIGKGSTSSFTDGINGIAAAVQKFVDGGGGKQIHDFLVQVGQAVITYFTSGQFQQTVASIQAFATNAAELTTDLLGLIRGAQGVKQWFDNLSGSNLGGAFQAALNPVGQLIGYLNGLGTLVRGMGSMWDTVKAATAQAWAAVSATVASWWNAILATITGKSAQGWATVTGAWGKIESATSAAWTAVTGFVSTAWAAIGRAVSAGISAVVGFVQGLRARITGGINSAWAQATSLTSSGWARVSSAVSTGVTNAVAFVKGLPGKAVAALATLGSQLFNAAFQAGYNLLQGLMAGIRALWGQVTSLVSNLASSISSTFSKVLQIHSPSRVMQQLGQFVAQGLIVGMTGSQSQVQAAAAKLGSLVQSAVNSYLSQKSSLAKKIAADATAVDKARERYANVVKLHGLTAANAINSARDQVANASQKLAADKSRGASAAAIRKDADALGQAQQHLQAVIKTQGTRTAIAVTNARESLQKAIAKLAGDKANLTDLNKNFGALGDPKAVALVNKVTKNYEGVLSKIAAAREDLATRLKDAQAKLADAMKIRDDYAASVRQATVDFANLTRAQAQEGQALTSQDVITNLRQKLAAINDFRNNIRALQAEGLSNDALKQLVDAGVEAGGATATALVQGGQAAVTEVNNLTAQIGSAAQDLGTTTAAQFFQAGVNQAQGLVDGLQAQSAALASQAAAIAQQMVDAITAVFAAASYDYGFHDKIPVSSKSSAKKAVAPVQVTVNNPVPETASQSTTRIMRSLATFGAAAPIYVPAR